MKSFFGNPATFFAYLSKFSGDDGEPFTIEITNSSPSPKSFYLSQGLNYTRGMETAGQLRTGTFSAVGETSKQSLTASTPNSIPIEQFIAYVQGNPQATYKIQSTSSNGMAQTQQNITAIHQGMTKNDAPVITPLRIYADPNSFHPEFQTYRKPRIFSATDAVLLSVAGNSTLTLDIYMMKKKPRISTN